MLWVNSCPPINQGVVSLTFYELSKIISWKIHNARNHIYVENVKLKICMCAQSMALGTHTKFQLEILIISTISAIHKSQEKILESLWNVSETPPRPHQRQSCMSGQALLHHWLCNQKHPWGICSCSPIVNFLKVTFYHGMVTLVIFLIKK